MQTRYVYVSEWVTKCLSVILHRLTVNSKYQNMVKGYARDQKLIQFSILTFCFSIFFFYFLLLLRIFFSVGLGKQIHFRSGFHFVTHIRIKVQINFTDVKKITIIPVINLSLRKSWPRTFRNEFISVYAFTPATFSLFLSLFLFFGYNNTSPCFNVCVSLWSIFLLRHHEIEVDFIARTLLDCSEVVSNRKKVKSLKGRE